MSLHEAHGVIRETQVCGWLSAKLFCHHAEIGNIHVIQNITRLENIHAT
jgi:hypothetical protein